jgi:hypothetical protein
MSMAGRCLKDTELVEIFRKSDAAVVVAAVLVIVVIMKLMT